VDIEVRVRGDDVHTRGLDVHTCNLVVHAVRTHDSRVGTRGSHAQTRDSRVRAPWFKRRNSWFTRADSRFTTPNDDASTAATRLRDRERQTPWFARHHHATPLREPELFEPSTGDAQIRNRLLADVLRRAIQRRHAQLARLPASAAEARPRRRATFTRLRSLPARFSILNSQFAQNASPSGHDSPASSVGTTAASSNACAHATSSSSRVTISSIVVPCFCASATSMSR